MQKSLKRLALSSSKGFTIIELIVVIAIIAVLAAIVLVSVVGYIQKSNLSAAEADMRQLTTLAATYVNDNGSMDNFCSSSSVQAVEDAIQKLNLNFPTSGNPAFMCSDEVSVSGFPGTLSMGPNPGCTDGQSWFAWMHLIPANPGPGALSSICVDKNGIVAPAEQFTTDCACVHQ